MCTVVSLSLKSCPHLSGCLQTMRTALGKCRPHSTIQGQALAGYKHIGRLFGLLWELPAGPARIASLHEGLKESTIHVHGSCTEVCTSLDRADQYLHVAASCGLQGAFRTPIPCVDHHWRHRGLHVPAWQQPYIATQNLCLYMHDELQ